MRGPTDEFRGELQVILEELALPEREFGVRVVTPDLEVYLDGILQRIQEAIESDVALGRESADPGEDFEAIESWLSVASYAFASVYAPQSPLPAGLVGVSKKIMRRMRRIAAVCSDPAGAAARALGATGYSIGVGFP